MRMGDNFCHDSDCFFLHLRRRKKRYARVLSIAGSDSGGGAGIQADLKTCRALGCYGMTAITAITVQNTLGVTGIHSIPVDTVRGQIDAVEDIGVDAVKIGMLATPDVVRAVADAIRRHRIRSVVLDPVMVATSGDRLIVPETAQALVQELFPLATVITPIWMKQLCWGSQHRRHRSAGCGRGRSAGHGGAGGASRAGI
jgi:hydroxymethylpyrimidine kinase/phosphomethylpyrimidine kinase